MKQAGLEDPFDLIAVEGGGDVIGGSGVHGVDPFAGVGVAGDYHNGQALGRGALEDFLEVAVTGGAEEDVWLGLLEDSEEGGSIGWNEG